MSSWEALGNHHHLRHPWRDAVSDGLEATLDLGQLSLTSHKHGIDGWRLPQASNGHLLMPLVSEDYDSKFGEPTEPGCLEVEATVASEASSSSEVPANKSDKPPKHLRNLFQTLMKKTRYCQVDRKELGQELDALFGCHVSHGLCAYKPKFERIPTEAHTQTLEQAVATLSQKGELHISPWQERPAGIRSTSRAPASLPLGVVMHASVCEPSQVPKRMLRISC